MAVLAVVLLPGMDMAYVLASSISGGRKGGISAVLGMATGGIIHVLVGGTGIAALMLIFPQLFNLILFSGTIYLVWIGWAFYSAPAMASPSSEKPAMAHKAIYGKAVMTCMLNPKAYAFMFAIFPAFIHTETRTIFAQTIALGLITASTQIAVYGAIALVAAQFSLFIRSRSRGISRIVGIVLIATALMTAFHAWRSNLTDPRTADAEQTIQRRN